ncbi:MAG: dynamin family protein [Sulfurovaceae bacterium]|nr:dynamin family protein [Sulfurovaceae bacterium]
MLKIQNKYIDYISKVDAEIAKTNLTDLTAKKFQLKNSIEVIEKTELIVPVIGAFSAGKSSLLNSFLGDRKLPEKITPETALATELRYSEHECIQAVKSDDSAETFSIDDINNIKQRACEFKYLRMYLNNDSLKKIQPLILVDMPGFESPLDLHNQAIMEYINRGVHYVVLTSVEDGSITKSMTRQLENIQEYRRDFSFFLSKTNLKPSDEVEAIKKKVQEQLEDYFDKTDEIGLVDDNGGGSLERILSQIDPEKLFENIFKENLKDNFFSIKEAINTNISALSKSKDQNSNAIQQLQKSLSETTRKKDNLIEEAKAKYSDRSVNRIVEAVGRDLSDSIDELVSAGINGGSSALSNAISEITKSSLITNVQSSMSSISSDIVDDFSTELAGLNSTMSDFTLSENWLENITSTTKKMFDSASNGLNDLLKNRKDKSTGKDATYKAITTVLAVTTSVLTPLLELVVVFLPDILSAIFGSMQEKKQKAQIQQTILTNTIPSLKRELRTKLPEIFDGQIHEIIQSIANRFEGIIKEKQYSIEASQKEIDDKNIDLEKTVEAYKNANDNITTLANNTLYKG